MCHLIWINISFESNIFGIIKKNCKFIQAFSLLWHVSCSRFVHLTMVCPVYLALLNQLYVVNKTIQMTLNVFLIDVTYAVSDNNNVLVVWYNCLACTVIFCVLFCFANTIKRLTRHMVWRSAILSACTRCPFSWRSEPLCNLPESLYTPAWGNVFIE